jgi:hypothetical protein
MQEVVQGTLISWPHIACSLYKNNNQQNISCVSYFNKTIINNNQPEYQTANDYLVLLDTSVCQLQHTFTLGIILGITDAD